MKIVDSNSFELFLDICRFYLCTSCETKTSRWHPKFFDTVSDDPYNFHHTGHLVENLKNYRTKSATYIINKFMAVFAENNGEKKDYLNLFIEGLNKDLKPNFICDDHEIASFFYNNRKKIFIFHGPEKLLIAKMQYTIYPFRDSILEYSFIDNSRQYAINTDFPPFEICRTHFDKGIFNSIYPWNYFAGYISLRDFELLGGKILKLKDREHFYAESNIEISKWFFISDFRSMDYYIEKYNKSKLGKLRPAKLDGQELRNYADIVRQSGGKIITIDLLRKYFHLLDLVYQKLLLLNSTAYQ